MRQDPKWVAHLANKPVLSRSDCFGIFLLAIVATGLRHSGTATVDNALGGRFVEGVFVWGAAVLAAVVCFWGANRTAITTSERDRAVLALAVGTLLLGAYSTASWLVTGWTSAGGALIAVTMEAVSLASLAWMLRRKRAVEKPAANG